MFLLEKFQTHFAQLLPHKPNVLLALSGGVDSVVLFYLLTQLPEKTSFRAIHIHHGLTPHADKWADFCRQLCAQFHVPFVLEKVSVGGKNVEAEARQARYEAISRHIQPNETLLTAHHLDDQAETFFLALKRGSGVKGLAAMPTLSHAHGFPLCRPLLCFRKAELHAFALHHGLRWVNDESNQSIDFDRNFLRNEIFPSLNARWAQFSPMVARASQHCAEQQALLEELLAEELNKRLENHGFLQSLNIEGFAKFSLAKQQALLRQWFAHLGEPMPSRAQLAQMIQNVILAQADKNPQCKLGEKWLRRHHQRLFITLDWAQMPVFSAPLLLDVPLILPNALGEIWRNQTTLFCKIHTKLTRLPLPEALQNQSLSVKLGVTGKVSVYGRSQREEMKKIWQQHNVPVWLRTRTPLLFAGAQLVAVLSICAVKHLPKGR